MGTIVVVAPARSNRRIVDRAAGELDFHTTGLVSLELAPARRRLHDEPQRYPFEYIQVACVYARRCRRSRTHGVAECLFSRALVGSNRTAATTPRAFVRKRRFSPAACTLARIDLVSGTFDMIQFQGF
jgi:hypothetical protein